MHVISIQGSHAQKSKLRNGHKVRIKHGAGFNVIVNPSTYHIVSRAFLKDKGISLQLTPEELAMNKSPSPEMQQQIMGHKEHMVIPGVTDHINVGGRGLGTGIGDFFNNLGNQIKSGFENTIQKPIENNIINPAKDLVNKYIPQDIQQDIGKVGKAIDPVDVMKRLKNGEKIQDIVKSNFNSAKDVYDRRVPDEYKRDINTASRFTAPGLALDMYNRIQRGEKPMDTFNRNKEDLIHLNNTKNRIIKSSPALTEAYKKGVMTTAGLGSAALGSAFGLSPVTGALAGAAAAKGADELLKAEGYGLHHHPIHGLHHHPIHGLHHHPVHHVIDMGMHIYNKHKKHRHPIHGLIGRGHISDFFKHAGKRVKDLFHHAAATASHVATEGKDKLSKLHNFILNNPALGAKVKEHGSKLAGILAKEGIKYATGNNELGELAGKVGEEAGQHGLKHVGYGEEKPKSSPPPPPPHIFKGTYLKMPPQHSPLQHDSSAYHMARQEMAHKGMFPPGGHGLYAGRQKGYGLYSGSPPMAGGGPIHHFGIINPSSRLVGGGFNSYDTLHQSTIDNAKANHMLARMQDRTIHGQHEASPIRTYYDGEGEPPSRGYGIHKNHHGKVHHMRKAGFEKSNHYNLVRGRGSLLEHKSVLPPALQSQPYGSNFHMQNMLPPQYQKYNDGTNEF